MKEQLIIYPEFDERIERDFLYTVSVTQGDRTERLTDGCLAWFHSPISPSSVAGALNCLQFFFPTRGKPPAAVPHR